MPPASGGDASFEFTTNLFQLEKQMEQALERLSRATANVKGPDLSVVDAAMRRIDQQVSGLYSRVADLNSAANNAITAAAGTKTKSAPVTEDQVFTRRVNDAARQTLSSVEDIFKSVARENPAAGAVLRDYVQKTYGDVQATLGRTTKEYVTGLEKTMKDAGVQLRRAQYPDSPFGVGNRTGSAVAAKGREFEKLYGGENYERAVGRGIRNAAEAMQAELIKGLSPKAQKIIAERAERNPQTGGLGDYTGAGRKVTAELKAFEDEMFAIQRASSSAIGSFRDLATVLNTASAAATAETAAIKAQTAVGAGAAGGGKKGGGGGGGGAAVAAAGGADDDGSKRERQARTRLNKAQKADRERIAKELERDAAFRDDPLLQGPRGPYRKITAGRFYDTSTETIGANGLRDPNTGTVRSSKTLKELDQIDRGNAIDSLKKIEAREEGVRLKELNRINAQAAEAERNLAAARQASAQAAGAVVRGAARGSLEADLRATQEIRIDPANQGVYGPRRIVNDKYYYDASTEQLDPRGGIDRATGRPQTVYGTGQVRDRKTNQLVTDTTQLNNLQLKYLNDEIRLAKQRGQLDDRYAAAVKRRNTAEMREFERTGGLGRQAGVATVRDNIEAEIRRTGTSLVDLGRAYYKDLNDPAGTFRYKNTGFTVQREGTNYAAAAANNELAEKGKAFGPFEVRLQEQERLARQARLNGDLPNPSPPIREVNRNTVFDANANGYFDRRSGARLEEGSQQLSQAMREDSNVLTRLAQLDRERAALTELTNNALRGTAQNLRNNLFRDTTGGVTRYAQLTTNGARYLDPDKDALRIRQAEDLESRSRPKTARQGFVAGLTSAGFGGASGDFNIAGLSQAAGTTVKYTALYTVLNEVQQLAGYAATELLNYADSVRNLELAAGSALPQMADFNAELARTAQKAGVNLGDLYDQAAIGMRAFGKAAEDTNSILERQNTGEAFAEGIRRLSLVTGDTYDQSSTNLRAGASGNINEIRGLSAAEQANRFNAIADAAIGARQNFGGDANDIAQGIGTLSTAAQEAGFTIPQIANLIGAGTAQLGTSGTLFSTRFSRILSIFSGKTGQRNIAEINADLPAAQKINTNASSFEQLYQLAEIFPELSKSVQATVKSQVGGEANFREFQVFLNNFKEIAANNDYTGLFAEQEEDLEKTVPRLLERLAGVGSGLVIQGGSQSQLLTPFYLALRISVETLEEFINGIITVNTLFTKLENILDPLNIFQDKMRGVIATVIAFGAALKLASVVRNAGGLRNVVTGNLIRAEQTLNPTGAYFRNLNNGGTPGGLTDQGVRQATAASANTIVSALMPRVATAAERNASLRPPVAPTAPAAPATKTERPTGPPIGRQDINALRYYLQGNSAGPVLGPYTKFDPRVTSQQQLAGPGPGSAAQRYYDRLTGVSQNDAAGSPREIKSAEAAARAMQVAYLQLGAQRQTPEEARNARDERNNALRERGAQALTARNDANQAVKDARRELNSARAAYGRAPATGFGRDVAVQRLAAAQDELTRSTQAQKVANQDLSKANAALRNSGVDLGRGLKALGSSISNVVAAGRGAGAASRESARAAADERQAARQAAAQTFRETSTRSGREAAAARAAEAARVSAPAKFPGGNELDQIRREASNNAALRANAQNITNAQNNLNTIRAQAPTSADPAVIKARTAQIQAAEGALAAAKAEQQRLQTVQKTLATQRALGEATTKASTVPRAATGGLRDFAANTRNLATGFLRNNRAALAMAAGVDSLRVSMAAAAATARGAAAAVGGSALVGGLRNLGRDAVGAFKDLKASLNTGIGLLTVGFIGAGLVKSAATTTNDFLDNQNNYTNAASSYGLGGQTAEELQNNYEQLQSFAEALKEGEGNFHSFSGVVKKIADFFNSSIGNAPSNEELTAYAEKYNETYKSFVDKITEAEGNVFDADTGEVNIAYGSLESLNQGIEEMQTSGLSATLIFGKLTSGIEGFTKAGEEGSNRLTKAQQELVIAAAQASFLKGADQNLIRQKYEVDQDQYARDTNNSPVPPGFRGTEGERSFIEEYGGSAAPQTEEQMKQWLAEQQGQAPRTTQFPSGRYGFGGSFDGASFNADTATTVTSAAQTAQAAADTATAAAKAAQAAANQTTTSAGTVKANAITGQGGIVQAAYSSGQTAAAAAVTPLRAALDNLIKGGAATAGSTTLAAGQVTLSTPSVTTGTMNVAASSQPAGTGVVATKLQDYYNAVAQIGPDDKIVHTAALNNLPADQTRNVITDPNIIKPTTTKEGYLVLPVADAVKAAGADRVSRPAAEGMAANQQTAVNLAAQAAEVQNAAVKSGKATLSTLVQVQQLQAQANATRPEIATDALQTQRAYVQFPGGNAADKALTAYYSQKNLDTALANNKQDPYKETVTGEGRSVRQYLHDVIFGKTIDTTKKTSVSQPLGPVVSPRATLASVNAAAVAAKGASDASKTASVSLKTVAAASMVPARALGATDDGSAVTPKTATTAPKSSGGTVNSQRGSSEYQRYNSDGVPINPIPGGAGLYEYGGDQQYNKDGKRVLSDRDLETVYAAEAEAINKFFNNGGDLSNPAMAKDLETNIRNRITALFKMWGIDTAGVASIASTAVQTAVDQALSPTGSGQADFSLGDIGGIAKSLGDVGEQYASEQGVLASLGSLNGKNKYGTLIQQYQGLSGARAAAQANVDAQTQALADARAQGEQYINDNYTGADRTAQLALLEDYLSTQKIRVAQAVKEANDAAIVDLRLQTEYLAATIPSSDQTAQLENALKGLEDQRKKLTDSADLKQNLIDQITAATNLSDSRFADAQASGLADIDPQNTLARARREAQNAQARLERIQKGYDIDANGQRYTIDPQSRTKAEADARDAAASAQAQVDALEREARHAENVSKLTPENLVGLAQEQVRYTAEQVEYLRIHAYGTAEYFNAVEANEQAIIDEQQKIIDRDYASKLAKIDPRAGSSRAQAALDKAQSELALIEQGTQAYYEKQAEIIQDMINLAEAQAQEASNARKLLIDLTNPVQTAQEDLKKAKDAYAAAVAQLDAQGITDPAERAKVLDPLRIDELNAQASADQAAFQQRLSDMQIADRLGRITHAAYLQYLQGEHDRLTQQLAGMKETDQMYRQYVDQLNTVDEALKDAKDAMNQMYNLQDVTIPSIYEVRRAIGASADQIRSQVVDYSSTNGTVIINGADMGTVVAYINKVLGTGSTSVYTTSPRRV